MIRPYEWMVQPTPQYEWIERRGVLLWLAFFFGGLGGGLYLVSLYFNNIWGLFIGWLIVLVLKGGTHLAYLGKPLRFWRGVLKPGTSWISRGLIGIIVFLVFGALQLAPSWGVFSWLPWTSDTVALQVLAAIGAFWSITYTGFALNNVNAISFWNTALMPVLFILYALLGGAGLTLATSIAGVSLDIELVERILLWLLIAAVIILGIYLWSSYYTTLSGRESVLDVLRGRSKIWFYAGVVGLGIVVPLAVAIYGVLVTTAPHSVLGVAVACEFIGGLSIRYCVLKSGIHSPLI